jgi:protein-tyrosine phosphatase
MYVDVHCHLLPGVDDGAADWAESLECLQLAKREKITTILVTPHIHPDRYPNKPENLRAAFSEWREKAAGLGFDLHLGSEVFFRPDLVGQFEKGALLPMGEAGRYLLVELPLLLWPPGVAQTFFELQLSGVEPILAHPERYPYVAANPDRLEALASSGVPFQVTSHSVVGIFGAKIQRAAFSMLEKGWVAIVASDAHSPGGRAPLFREAVRVINRRYGKEAARRLTVENPRRVIAGEPLLPVPCVRLRRGLLG